MEIDLSDLPQRESEAILAAIELPLTVGMPLESVKEVLGEPIDVLSFVEDRKTFIFQIGSADTYKVDCTIQDDVGLIFVSVLRDDVLQKIEGHQPMN